MSAAIRNGVVTVTPAATAVYAADRVRNVIVKNEDGTIAIKVGGPGVSYTATDTNEVQTITTDADAGTFTVSFNGVATGPLAFGITAANLQIALRALSTVGGANANVTHNGSPWVVTFVGTLAATDVALLVVDSTLLTTSGGASVTTVVETTKGGSQAAAGVNLAAGAQLGPLTVGSGQTLYAAAASGSPKVSFIAA